MWHAGAAGCAHYWSRCSPGTVAYARTKFVFDAVAQRIRFAEYRENTLKVVEPMGLRSLDHSLKVFNNGLVINGH